MIANLVPADTLLKIFMNTVLVSIPEEFFILMFTLILVGEFEHWSDENCVRLIHRYDYVRVFVPVVVTALLSNIFRFTGFNMVFTSLVPVLMFYILIVLTNDIFGDASAMKWAGKAFLFFLLGFLTIIITEFSYVSFFLYLSGKTVEEMNNDILLNFIVSLPSRIVEYSILLFLIAKKRSSIRANILKSLFESKLVLILLLIVVVFDVAFMFVMGNAVAFEKVLESIPGESRMVVILGITLFPIINLSALIWGVYTVKNREASEKKLAVDKLKRLLSEIRTYSEKRNYDNLEWKLHEIGKEIEEVVSDLNKSEQIEGDYSVPDKNTKVL